MVKIDESERLQNQDLPHWANDIFTAFSECWAQKYCVVVYLLIQKIIKLVFKICNNVIAFFHISTSKTIF